MKAKVQRVFVVFKNTVNGIVKKIRLLPLESFQRAVQKNAMFADNDERLKSATH